MDEAVDLYIDHLRMKRETPNVNYLQRLIQHQLSLIPYESISKFQYFEHETNYIPTFETFVQNLKRKGWGGTCFNLNINFSRLLTHLGFECAFVRVNPGHLAIMVIVEGIAYYVDVGYGSPIMKPVELEAKHVQKMHGFGEEIIFTKLDHNVYEIDRRSNGKTFVKKQIIWQPLTETEIHQDIQHSFLDDDENITMRRITAVKFNGHQCFYLRNNTLKVMTFRNISEFKVKDYKRWMKLVHDVYRINERTVEDSLRFLEERNILLFPS